jgi:hypothetical protein
MLSAALKYLNQLHYSVFPVGPDKKALIKWEPYQKRLPTEEEIRQWWEKYPDANIAIATGIISGVAVVDLDEVDEAKAALHELIPDSLVFPIVKTPSGGEHWYFACTDGELRNNTKLVPGADLRANGGYVVAPPSINGNGKGWKWQDKVNPSTLAVPYLPIAYKEYINKSIKGGYRGGVDNTDSLQVSTQSTSVYKMFEQGTRDEDLFHVANCLVKGKMPDKEITQVIEKLALSCNPPFDLRDIPIKIESAIKRSKARSVNLSEEVEAWVLSTTGNFLSTDIYKCLQLSTRDEHKNVSIILKRLLDKGIIEKWGERNGAWRVVDNEMQTIDWYNAEVKTLDIKWPFGIEDYVLTMPKNIICVAGSPNAGKTAFLLNVVKMNMKGPLPILYMSSEMGRMEMRSRIEKFDDVKLGEWRFTAKERSANFDTAINPNGLNIVDCMELSDKFYLVGGMLKAIYDKLENGIAIVALQKNPGASMARGGVGTLEKPRLYISLDAGKLKIEKAKNWKTQENPNGMMNDYKLVSGCKFIPSGWYDENDITRRKP